MNAWICAQRATDRDLESVFVERKVNAWICARHSTDRDLESVFNVNAWIRAPPTTDHDPANTHFFIKNCNACNACNACNFLQSRIVFDLLSSCNACNLIQAYCFRFYFLLVTVIILSTMVSLTFSCLCLSRRCRHTFTVLPGEEYTWNSHRTPAQTKSKLDDCAEACMAAVRWTELGSRALPGHDWTWVCARQSLTVHLPETQRSNSGCGVRGDDFVPVGYITDVKWFFAKLQEV